LRYGAPRNIDILIEFRHKASILLVSETQRPSLIRAFGITAKDNILTLRSSYFRREALHND
jgi:hypothetical protein